ncbi:putative pak-box p21-rho-binding protein [Rosellinia necatrix]|uniref:Putative pak-box p21-rho-binding protein n=1 Tax=Rosellinia necatrix TaxID=77044 RepID=A0A1W2TLU9_ROSNE|nr:putative pak-box p21-rho-binding protein [Rosellinia necatrix]
MFSSGSSSANFKALRRKAANDGSSSNFHTARPSTAATDHYHTHDITDLLGPALDGPPSPEGIRAFRRRMKRGSMIEQQANELATSSGSSSLRSESREASWERSLENLNISRNSSQRSSVMAVKERPESVQLFGKAVFGRRAKLRRGQSGQGHPNGSLVSLTEIPTDTTPDLPKEQHFIHSMFTRRRTRGASETLARKYQISGPYDFQHVLHSSKEQVPDLEQINRHEALPNFSGARPRTTTDASNMSARFNSQVLDKPLPTPPSVDQDLEGSPSQDGFQFSPPRPLQCVHGDVQTSPIPPPRTSSRMSVCHDRGDSFSSTGIEKLRANPGYQAQSFILPTTEGLWPPPVSHISHGYSEADIMGRDGNSPYPITSSDDTAWPLTSSMSSLPEVPEEEEYHLTNIRSRASIMSNRTSLRGSISVPYLRRVSLSQGTQRPPSNASDTLGRFDLLAAQHALHKYDDGEMNEDEFAEYSWEDDIDYCYNHAAEADCDFAWERLSCDLEREGRLVGGLLINHRAESSFGSFGPVSKSFISTDLPGLSPASLGSAATQHRATTPTTSSTAPVTSNFSLPRIDTSAQLTRDHTRSDSSASSFQEVQGFCLSPSLLIPNDYHECLLEYERGHPRSHASSDELKIAHHDDHYLKLDKPRELMHTRSSASTTASTISEQSHTSSRYPSSTFTRWTGSSSSSWQAHVDPPQPVIIAINDKEQIITPAGDITTANAIELSVGLSKQETGRDTHSRAQSEATLLLKVAAHDTVAPLEPKSLNEPPKTHRRARTASRSHANASPQFALFPQVPQRP